MLEAHTEQDRAAFAELKADIKELHGKVAELQVTMERSRGFIGGVIFIVSAVWAVVAIFSGSVAQWFKG